MTALTSRGGLPCTQAHTTELLGARLRHLPHDEQGVNSVFTLKTAARVICIAAEKPLRTHHGKATSMVKSLRESWEPSIHLDGRPVERFGAGSNRPLRTHRYTRVGKESRSPLVEDVGKTFETTNMMN